MGDPISDPDPERDREGTNVTSGKLLHKRFSPKARTVGKNPEAFPEDRWIAEAAVRFIAAEDPDVLYALLAECDTSQHAFGAADRPEEWIDPGTPNILWDDTNQYNERANRDPVLDIVYEADQSFGVVLDTLASRNTLDDSVVVMLSDHGQVTAMETPLPVGEILLQLGVGEEAVEYMLSRHSVTFLYLTDPSRAPSIAALLEDFETHHPVLNRAVKPFIVFDTNEMESGIDNIEGLLLEDGIMGNRRGELYSEWTIEFPVPDTSKVKWPELMLFNRHRYQNVLVSTKELGAGFRGPKTIGTHAAPSSADIPIALRGPGIAAGVYSENVTLADIIPTLYRLLGLAAPPNVDGAILEQILAR
jgi:arylsulfatase A-like enzyme